MAVDERVERPRRPCYWKHLSSSAFQSWALLPELACQLSVTSATFHPLWRTPAARVWAEVTPTSITAQWGQLRIDCVTLCMSAKCFRFLFWWVGSFFKSKRNCNVRTGKMFPVKFSRIRCQCLNFSFPRWIHLEVVQQQVLLKFLLDMTQLTTALKWQLRVSAVGLALSNLFSVAKYQWIVSNNPCGIQTICLILFLNCTCLAAWPQGFILGFLNLVGAQRNVLILEPDLNEKFILLHDISIVWGYNLLLRTTSSGIYIT